MMQRGKRVTRLSSTVLSAILFIAKVGTVDAFSAIKGTSKDFHGVLHQSSFLASPPSSISHSVAATRRVSEVVFPSWSYDVKRKGLLLAWKNEEDGESVTSFDPLSVADDSWESEGRTLRNPVSGDNDSWIPATAALSTIAALPFVLPDEAVAESAKSIQIPKSLTLQGNFDPDQFKPVCPASDGFYRVLQGTAYTVVGEDNFVEYGPIIASGLLRIRLELCVVESFFNEAVGPFIKQNGLSWILPLHETVETFLAGTIFALATTFILVGSTKLISVILTYTDVFLGGPCRFFGSYLLDRSKGIPVTFDIGFGPLKKRIIGPPDEEIKKASGEEDDKKLLDLEGITPANLPFVIASGTLKYAGETSKILRDVMESLDLFVGRYLTLIATGYIALKFVHFKVFPDFPPF
mmetsp:Transcript_7202/g.9770  ORF Transcript_7202/g.9770 Transcript_7202/m.9770 type:complete len:408 (-) Transcript_7202:250-1473(-)